MTRIVCLGDSFTEGMCDVERTDGHHLGWADRVAAGLAQANLDRFPAPIEYANLAVRGKLLDQVLAEQVEPALAMKPDLITFHGGGNDVLRPKIDRPALYRRYDGVVARLVDSSATVVLFTSLTRTGGRGRIADRVAALFQEFNANVREVAERHGCVLVDDEALTVMSDRRFWAPDRLHLNALGHARVAANVLAGLGVTDPDVLGGSVGWWEQPLPPEGQRTRREALAADAAWVRTHLVPWIGRRVRGVSSGDGMDPKDPILRLVAG